MQLLYIAAGGAAGSVLRYLTSSAIYGWLGKGFPWGTFAVNVIGSFAMGVLATLVVEKVILSEEFKNALLIGFLGAFTTFSTFSLDTLNLFFNGHGGRAIFYAVASVVACVLATLAGMLMTRHF